MSKFSFDTLRTEPALRSLLGRCALLVVPLFVGLVMVAKSPRLVDVTAVDHAQVARHIAAGDGVATSLLRPLLLALDLHTSPQPDLVNAPAHPLVLALAYFVAGPSDQTTIVVGLGLWVLSVWLVFWVTRYWWNERVAALAAVFYACNIGGLRAAVGGLPQPLLALFVLGAMWAAVSKCDVSGKDKPPLPVWRLMLAGVLCGCVALTDYLALPLSLVLAIYLGKTQPRRIQAVAVFAGGLIVVLLPWLMRNILTGAGLFGFYGYGALTNTRAFFGESIWRTGDIPPHPLLYVVTHPQELVHKLLHGVARYRLLGVAVLEPIVVFLFAVACFGKRTAGLRRQLAWITFGSAALIVLASCVWQPEPRLLLGWFPLIAAVGAAQLESWTRSNIGTVSLSSWRHLQPEIAQMWVRIGVVSIVMLEFLIQLVSAKTYDGVWSKGTAAAIVKQIPEGGVVLTDQPAEVAWRLQRPALWLCEKEEDLDRFQIVTGPIKGVYVSPAVATLFQQESSDWWVWIISPRGVYRGLVPVANSPLPGVLRLAVEPHATSSEPSWRQTLMSELRQNPQWAEAHLHLALGCFAHGWFREAHKEFQVALQLNDCDVDAQIGLWEAWGQLSQTDASVRLAELASQVVPLDPHARAMLQPAIAHFAKALTEQRNNPWLILNLMACHARMGESAKAQAACIRLADAMPKTSPPQLVLAHLYLQQGLLQQAEAECEQLLQSWPYLPSPRYLLGKVRDTQGRFEEALLEFNKAAELRPGWPAPRLHASLMCLKLKRYEEARKQIASLQGTASNAEDGRPSFAQMVLMTAPNNSVALRNLTELLAQDGHTAEALVLGQRAISLFPSDPAIRDTTGWAFFLAGRNDEALLHLREAVRMAPDMAIANYHLGKLLHTSGNNQEARGFLQRSLDLGLPEAVENDAVGLIPYDQKLIHK